MERRVASVVARVDVCTAAQSELGDLFQTILARHRQDGIAELVPHVDWHAAVEKRRHLACAIMAGTSKYLPDILVADVALRRPIGERGTWLRIVRR